METKKLLVFLTLGVSLFSLSACQSKEFIRTYEDPVPFQEQDSSTDGVILSLIDTVFPSSPSTIYSTIQNTTNNSCSYGGFFQLDKNLDGQWYGVIYSDAVFYKYPDFKDFGLILQPGGEDVQVFSPTRLNLTLPEGQYRLVKTVRCPATNGYEISLSVPFWVEG